MQRPSWPSGSNARASISWRQAVEFLRLFKRSAPAMEAPIVSPRPTPPEGTACENIENNPMQSSGVIDTPSRDCTLTRRANQLYHANLTQIARRIRPCSASDLPRFNARADRTRSPRTSGRHRCDLGHNVPMSESRDRLRPAATGPVRYALFGLDTAVAIDHLVGKADPAPWPPMPTAPNSRRVVNHLMPYPPTSPLMMSPNNSQRSPLNFLS